MLSMYTNIYMDLFTLTFVAWRAAHLEHLSTVVVSDAWMRVVWLRQCCAAARRSTARACPPSPLGVCVTYFEENPLNCIM